VQDEVRRVETDLGLLKAFKERVETLSWNVSAHYIGPQVAQKKVANEIC
jgi:hypothetical protein